MEKEEKFFIFTWKELMVIGLLGLSLIGFFFTLGLHYGKKIGVIHPSAHHEDRSEKLEEAQEQVPSRELLEEGSNYDKAVASNSIKKITKEELSVKSIGLEQPKAVDLPEEKTTKKIEKTEAASNEITAVFSIQLGSYATKKEALQKTRNLNKKSVQTEIRTAQVNGQIRYRVIIPGFKTKSQADQKGKELKSRRKIDNFIVIR